MHGTGIFSPHCRKVFFFTAGTLSMDEQDSSLPDCKIFTPNTVLCYVQVSFKTGFAVYNTDLFYVALEVSRRCLTAVDRS
jgi:hypothetical protein